MSVSWVNLILETWRNKSIGRTLMNFEIQKHLCLFKHSDHRDLAEKLKNVVDNDCLRGKMGAHNLEKVIKTHSISHLTSSLVNIFKGWEGRKR